MRSASRRVLVLLTVGLLTTVLLGGCGSDPVTPGGAATPTSATGSLAPTGPPPTAPAPPESTTTGPTTTGSTAGESDLSDLASAAEQAASAVPSTVPAPVPNPGAGGPQPQVLGGDISWPQCPIGLGIPERPTQGLPGPLSSAVFVVIGLTNGPGFTSNPCLGDQVADARERGLLTAAYAVLSYPDTDTLAERGAEGPGDAETPTGRLVNVGFAQAAAGVVSLRTSGLRTPVVWLDVESVPGFDWSTDPAANAAVVRGAARGYTQAGYRVGVYSTPALWRRIVGDLSLGAAEWRPAGASSRQGAEDRCGMDWTIQGGAAVLVQWVEQQRDLDVTCPGSPGAPADWFARPDR